MTNRKGNIEKKNNNPTEAPAITISDKNLSSEEEQPKRDHTPQRSRPQEITGSHRKNKSQNRRWHDHRINQQRIVDKLLFSQQCQSAQRALIAPTPAGALGFVIDNMKTDHSTSTSESTGTTHIGTRLGSSATLIP